MKKFIFKLFPVVLLAMFFSLQSCGPEKYTVWTASSTYDEFRTAFNMTLEDGTYSKAEIKPELWGTISKQLTSEGRHSWDEATIQKWLYSNGFGYAESSKEASWFALIEHGFIASRSGNTVYFMLK